MEVSNLDQTLVKQEHNKRDSNFFFPVWTNQKVKNNNKNPSAIFQFEPIIGQDLHYQVGN